MMATTEGPFGLRPGVFQGRFLAIGCDVMLSSACSMALTSLDRRSMPSLISLATLYP